MTRLRLWLAATLAILTSPALGNDVPTAAIPFAVGDNQGIFLAITDIHFDPFAKPDLVPKLDHNPVDQWSGIFAAGAGSDFQGYGSDAGFPLAVSAMTAAAGLGIDYDYVIYTGDYLSHDFGADYARYAGPNPQGLTDFSIKTSLYVGALMQEKFGNAPIFGVMGNNDSACGDYMIAPDSAYTAGLRGQWEALSRQPGRFGDFAVGGFYKIAHPTVPDTDIIVLNNIFWDAKYYDGCKPDGGDPGAAMMAWLDWQLYQSQQAGRKVQILMHEPPGINAYSTSRASGMCAARITPFWNDRYSEGFVALMRKYRGVIDHSFTGHTHMDGFAVVSDEDGTPLVANHITPSVSPIFGNNPAFSVYLYDLASGAVIDSATFYLANLAATQSGAKAIWQPEYVFSAAYRQDDMSAASLAKLAQHLNTSENMRDSFIAYYPASSRQSNPVNAANWKAFSCAQTAIGKAEYEACYCSVPDPDTKRRPRKKR